MVNSISNEERLAKFTKEQTDKGQNVVILEHSKYNMKKYVDKNVKVFQYNTNSTFGFNADIIIYYQWRYVAPEQKRNVKNEIPTSVCKVYCVDNYDYNTLKIAELGTKIIFLYN